MTTHTAAEDQELLELAAKAAGYARAEQLHDGRFGVWRVWRGQDGEIGGDELVPWNPLTDDGDALRLAVKLGLRIYAPDDGYPIAVVRDWKEVLVVEEDADYYAATRRAIVRAAAAIAKGE